jgi:hypothetical protein
MELGAAATFMSQCHDLVFTFRKPRNGRTTRRSARRRATGVLGLQDDAATGDRCGEAAILHHALSRQDAGEDRKNTEFAIV